MYLKQLNNPANDFAMVPRQLVRLGLSVEAVGLMVFVACHRAERITAAQIEECCGIGRDKRQRIMRELREAGLLSVIRETDGRGRFSTGYAFDWDAITRTKRQAVPDVIEPEPENPALVDQRPEPENPAPGLKNRPNGPENPAVLSERAAPTPRPEGAAAAEPRTIGPIDRLRRAEQCKAMGLAYRDEAGNWHEPERRAIAKSMGLATGDQEEFECLV